MPPGTPLRVLNVLQRENLDIVADAFWELHPAWSKSCKNVKYKQFKVVFMRDVVKAFVFGKTEGEVCDLYDDYMCRRMRFMTREEMKSYMVTCVFASLGLNEVQKNALMNM